MNGSTQCVVERLRQSEMAMGATRLQTVCALLELTDITRTHYKANHTDTVPCRHTKPRHHTPPNPSSFLFFVKIVPRCEV